MDYFIPQFANSNWQYNELIKSIYDGIYMPYILLVVIIQM